MGEKVRDFFRQNIGYFIVGFACVIYILTAFFRIDKTGKTVSQIIADGALCFFLGVFINRIFDLQGMMSGSREESVMNTIAEHSKIVLKISPHIEELDKWCEAENAKNYKTQRTKILARAGLKYETCFDEDGVAIPFTVDKEKLKDKALRLAEYRKLRGYHKAVNLKLTALSGGELTSEGGRQQDPFYFGRTKAQYETQRSLKDIFAKFGTAIIFGVYGAELIKDFNYASLIWTTLQVALFLVMGVIKMYQSYMFVTDEYKGRIWKKIDNLQKFDNYIANLPKEEKTVEVEQNELQNES